MYLICVNVHYPDHYNMIVNCILKWPDRPMQFHRLLPLIEIKVESTDTPCRARDSRLNRDVAIKVLHSPPSTTPIAWRVSNVKR